MVLLALSTVLGVAYILVSTATVNSSMRENSSMKVEARMAAQSGAMIAYRKMVDAAWSGLDSSYSQTLDDGVTYTATYTLGDASLPADDPDQPYLVTITVDATVDNPMEGSADTTHTSKFVVRLVPKVADPQPNDWSNFLNYTVYQTNSYNAEIEYPCRIEGNVRFQKKFKFCDTYPGDVEDWGGNDVLFVVVNPSSLTGEESKRSTYLSSAGFDVTLIDESASQASFNAAVAINDVVFVSEDVLSGNLNTKASLLTIGVVNEENALNNDLGTASSGGEISDRRYVLMSDTTHFITETYTQNTFHAIFSSNQPATRISGTKSPDLRILCKSVKLFSTTYDSLGVLDSAQETYDSKYTTSRRVQLPWGGGAFDFDALDDDGKTLLVRSFAWAATENARRRLFCDVNVKHLEGGADHRPLSGEISMPFANQDDGTTNQLEDWLGLTLHDVAITSVATDWTAPSSYVPTSYKLYDKGKTYTPTALTSGRLADVTLSADPETNPLGIFTYANDVTIGNNVTINGTLLCGKNF